MTATTDPALSSHRLHRPALAALATSSFVFVATETMPIGLLPQVAAGLEVSEGTAGTLLTSYAAVAALTTIPATALTLRVDRRRLVVVLVAVFSASQLAAALAPSFLALSLSRLLCAVAHGVFWSAVAAIAARLAPPDQAGRATAVVFVGNSLALVLGLPLGTALGQLVGWRAAFGALAVAGVVSTIALARLLPPLPSHVTGSTSAWGATVRPALDVVRSRPLLAVCGVTVVVVVGHFAAYTFVAPLVRQAGGIDGTALSVLLLGYGAAGLVGTLVAGRLVDRRPGPVLLAAVAAVVVSLLVLAAAPGPAGTWVAALAWGIGFSAVPLVLQAAVLRVVPRARDAGSSVYVVVFQVGIGGGALLGSAVVDGGELGRLPTLAAAVVVAGAVLVTLAHRVFPLRHGGTLPTDLAPDLAPDPAADPVADLRR